MSNMKGQTLQESSTKLALAELRSVRWAQEQQWLMAIYQAIAQRYAYFRQVMFVGWFLLIMEITVMWWWTFIHGITWPKFVPDMVSRADSTSVFVLEAVQRRLDWWWDVAGVRLMWFRESVENFLDRNLTTIDKYLGVLTDGLWTIFTLVMKPFRSITEGASNYASQAPQLKPTMTTQKNNGTLRRNSEGYEAEDNDDDYRSDASMDSRRLMKEDSRGEAYMRHHTTAMAGGKFREAMYYRVRNELGIMRKNSIRFSTGIVNCARQMVERHTRPYGDSFLEFSQRWARELGILDLLQTIQEEMRGQPFLAQPLLLVRILSEAWLAFLLRLVRGKKSRRTRSMRSESLRRRALSVSGTSNPLPLSPAALQQSSEPVQPPPHLAVQTTLRAAALKEEEEDLEGFLSKDSALGSEDNRSETIESDQTISHLDEGLHTDSDLDQHLWNTNSDSGTQESTQANMSQVSRRSSTICTGSEKLSALGHGSQLSPSLGHGIQLSPSLGHGSQQSPSLGHGSQTSSASHHDIQNSSFKSSSGNLKSSTLCAGRRSSSPIEKSSTLSAGRRSSSPIEKSSTVCADRRSSSPIEKSSATSFHSDMLRQNSHQNKSSKKKKVTIK